MHDHMWWPLSRWFDIAVPASKKILKKILQINDKNAPFYGIVETSLKNNEIKKILEKRFKNIFFMR